MNDTSEQGERSVRLAKRLELIRAGIDPYPSKTKRTISCYDALIEFDVLVQDCRHVVLAGRIRNIRRHGGSLFLTVEDGTGRIQWYLKRDQCVEKEYISVKDYADIGDFVEGTGELFTTKTGEKTLRARSCVFLAKALMPLPEQWHGLSDIEVRYRKRYLDLISNPDIKKIFHVRSSIISVVRRYLEENGFIEVDTPILQHIATGAAARPFITHHNALDMPLYLRVAPELYLKRLVIGGFDRVFEVARCFRNEGIDHSHNPEFTQVEAYVAYADYEYLMNFVESLLASITDEVSSSVGELSKNHFSFNSPFERLTFRTALLKYTQIDIKHCTTIEKLKLEASNRDIDIVRYQTHGAILDELFKVFVRPRLTKPTFVTDYPVELSPLAKRKRSDPSLVERFQLVVNGMEIVNGFSEINDAIDQGERFDEQMKARHQGDDEAQAADEDFVQALEYGMPPTAGFGMGIDRLCALLTSSNSLKEVILFPTLRPKK